ncbi:MAG: hypothetical protein ACYTG6_00940 [Planctomycetota bacterium]|jgi:hypothetical protein
MIRIRTLALGAALALAACQGTAPAAPAPTSSAPAPVVRRAAPRADAGASAFSERETALETVKARAQREGRHALLYFCADW